MNVRLDQPRTAANAGRSFVHQRVEAFAHDTPEGIAIAFGDVCLSYAELNLRANRLAHHLRALGVGSGDFVAVALDRSPNLLIAFLATIKLGAAYLPLDPAYPKKRLAFMIKDSRPTVIISTALLAPTLPSADTPVLCVDALDALVAREAEHDPDIGISADDIAYVIYTSGSTGQPKGVLIPHGGLANVIDVQRSAFGVTSDDRVLQFASPSFDASIFDFTMALGSGATLVVASRAAMRPGEPLFEVLLRTRATIVTLPPHGLAILPRRPLPALRTIIVAGETCPVSVVRHWSVGRQFFNAYGPTEATIWSTLEQFGPDTINSAVIGRSIANVEIRILDPHLASVPVGEIGELFIGGVGVARGYLGRDALTAERFVYLPGSGERFYRTGDLVRSLLNGRFEFLSRVDRQIKVRGFRVEPGEVEAAFLSHPNVRQAVVFGRRGADDEQRELMAYLTVGGRRPTVSQLREHLRQSLPEHMLPRVICFLGELPLTPSGKVDISALPPPARRRPDLSAVFVEARTETEGALVSIVCALLGYSEVGVDDDFFELGGNSLRTAQLAARIRDLLGASIPLDRLFETPTIARWAASVDAMRAAGVVAKAQPTFSKPGRDEDLPVSFAQAQVWFIQQLHPANTAYQAQALIHFRGGLNIAILERALADIVRRHEMLRTTFHALDGHPVMRVHDWSPTHLKVIDLASRPADVRVVSAELFRRAFDLTRLPLFDWTLLRVSADEHALVVVEHHLIHDGWSFNVWLQELTENYKAFESGTASQLPELAIQFSDFTRWQQRWIASDEAAAQREFWKRNLHGSLPLVQLPIARPRPAIPSMRGGAVRVDIPRPLLESVRALSSREQTTVFTSMLTAFFALLHRYTGLTDICIGTAVANRPWVETERLIGMFVNTVALRADLSSSPDGREALRRTRALALAAFSNQLLPFSHVVESLRQDRSLSYSPINQIYFSFHDSPAPDLAVPGLEILPEVALSNATAKFDLRVTALPNIVADTLTFNWEYSQDLFDEEDIRGLATHYFVLLEALCQDSSSPLSALAILSPAENQKQLIEWNATAVDYPADALLHRLVEAQVDSTPNAVAATFGKVLLTYRELDARANQLARHLRRRGVSRDTLVGVFLDRSIDLIVAVLGILKAGGAYMPIDPDTPPRRHAELVTLASPKLVVTQGALSRHLRRAVDIDVVCLDDDSAEINIELDARVDVDITPDDLAYVIFTSGSTGKPVGAMNTHRAICNRLLAMQDDYPLSATDSLLVKTPLVFDVSVRELFWPLFVGARLVVSEPGAHRDPALIVHLVRQHNITILNLVPTLLRGILDEPGVTYCTSLRHVFSGGETLTPDLCGHCLDTLATKLHNLYGPTECAISVSRWTCERQTDRIRVPIGRPVANTQLYVFDDSMQLVPVGVTGEIYIGGVQVGAGYLHEPELTASRFVEHAIQAGGKRVRLFRTGDRGRRRSDGAIEFVGRNDDQVKVRGCRIALGEVEATLATHPGIATTVVKAEVDPDGNVALFAYYAVRVGHAVSPDELFEFVAQRLPSYSVPKRIFEVKQFALLDSGKVDRRTLPLLATDWAPESVPRSPAFPSDRIEHELKVLWEELLATQLGIDDDFFELGGHSMKAAQLVSRVGHHFGVEIPLSAFFAATTVRKLAGLIRRGIDGEVSSPLAVALQPLGSQRPLFCVHSITGEVFTFLPLARELGLDQPVYGIRATGLQDDESLVNDLESVASTYLTEIRRIQPVGPYRIAGHSLGGVIAFEMARQLQGCGDSAELVVLFDSYFPSSSEAEREHGFDAVHPFAEIDAKFALRYAEVRIRFVDGWRRYRPQKASVRVLGFQARERRVNSPDLGKMWEEYCDVIDVHHVAGSHSTLLSKSNIAELARTLRIELRRFH